MPDRYGFQTIATELDDRILRVTLNRPDRLNALDIVMHEELGELYGKIERDDDVDVVVLTGAGKAFCVGADFSQMEQNLARGGYPDGHPGLMVEAARIARTIVAGDGGPVLWPMLVGPNRAKEYLLTGDLMTGVEAERIGLVNHVVPRDE